jgi:multicomponent Na+:H+ antiporter subunit B
MTDLAVTLLLFFALVSTAIAIALLRSLFAVVMLSGVFSLLAALLFIAMDAVDVAFTEAAVGAGISSVLMLGTIALTARHEMKPKRWSATPLIIVGIIGAFLIYGTLDMPAFGDPNAPVQTYLNPDFIARTPKEIDVPNIVTAVLASYRGFDTMGEVAVVFVAGLGVTMLIGGSGGFLRRRYRETVLSRKDGQA